MATCIATVIPAVLAKTEAFLDGTPTYREVVARHERVCDAFPGISPLMVNKQVSGHFGEVMAVEVGARHFGINVLDAGVVQANIAIAAQRAGILPPELTIRKDEALTAKRRADVCGLSEDGTKHELESKAVSLIWNAAHSTVQFVLINLKPDIPRLVVTIFDWDHATPSAAVVCIADHMHLGTRRVKLDKYRIEAATFDALLDKLSTYEGAMVQKLDLCDARYSRLVGEIVANCNISGGLCKSTMTVNKAAHEFIVAHALGLRPTGDVRSPYDATDAAGRRIEIKTSTIAPLCDRHGLQAQFTKIKPGNHDELVAALHLPSEDLMLVITNFASKEGTISLSGNTLRILLGMFAEKSGGDKNALITSMHDLLGGPDEIDRIEREVHQMIEASKREDARASQLRRASLASAKRRAALESNPEEREKYVAEKSAQKKQRMSGYTAKVIKAVAAMPLKPKRPGQTDEEARAEMLEEAAAAESRAQHARHAENERRRRERAKAGSVASA